VAGEWGDQARTVSSDGYGAIVDARTWMTPLIIVANVGVFSAMAMQFNVVNGFNPIQLAVWGGNSITFDLSSQWWRLIAYQFLHINLIHLAVNMWVMWSVGRLTERFYGSFVLLLLYLASGLIAGLASIAWNPYIVSVGASGSIFGIISALTVFLIRTRSKVPISVAWYLVPTLLFVGVNLYLGLSQSLVDNAGHFGGIVAGLGLGLVVVPPRNSRGRTPAARGLAVALLVAVMALPPLWYVGAFHHRKTVFEEFAETHGWYVSRETPNLLLWANLALRASSGSISNHEIEWHFRKDILPFWVDADARLRREVAARKGGENPYLPLVADFAAIRLKWARAVISAEADPIEAKTALAVQDSQQASLVQARLDRAKLRSAAESLPRPLAHSAFVVHFMSLLPGRSWQCVDPPPGFGKHPSASDAPEDGPAERHAAGCIAQRIFTDGDYAALDSALRKYSASLADLPDGTARLEGVWNGLDDLFAYGPISVEETLRRTAEWRQNAPGSVAPELVEALMFRDWAYTARGRGYISTVSEQNLQLFLIRVEMAATGLREIAPRAQNSALWYELSLAVGRDQSLTLDRLRALFDKGASKFPGYLPIYSQMLISLMPRWEGSIDAVDNFIVDVSKKTGRGQIDASTYARLYIIYGNLEGEDYSVTSQANADPDLMRTGIEQLRRRYPHSDYILNLAARYYCINKDYPAYRAIRPKLKGHGSSLAWPDKLTIPTCDASSG
jgi:membrane associated rhomboid family serine protease